MSIPTQINQAGVELVKFYEGLRLKAYKDSVGYWTVGYGHKDATPPPCTDCTVVTESEAEQLLRNDLAHFLSGIQKSVSVPLNENQLAALCSFVFNFGLRKLQKSTLLKKLNLGDYQGVANEFPLWIYAGGKIEPGLIARRRAERDLFLKEV